MGEPRSASFVSSGRHRDSSETTISLSLVGIQRYRYGVTEKGVRVGVFQKGTKSRWFLRRKRELNGSGIHQAIRDTYRWLQKKQEGAVQVKLTISPKIPCYEWTTLVQQLPTKTPVVLSLQWEQTKMSVTPVQPLTTMGADKDEQGTCPAAHGEGCSCRGLWDL